MAYRFKNRRLRFKIWRRNKLLNTNKYTLNEEQVKAIKIVKRLIVDAGSELLCSAETAYGSSHKPRYIISNIDKRIFIKITYSKIRIINGIFKYDVAFSEIDPNLAEIKAFFSRNMERRLDKCESEIDSGVSRSLDSIIDGLVNK